MADSVFTMLSEIKAKTRRRAIALCDRLETEYAFECEAGPLRNCAEWLDLKKILAEACLDK